MASPKIIVSNHALFVHKYGEAFVDDKLVPALGRLVDADAARGLATRVVWLDREEDVKERFGLEPITKTVLDETFTADDCRAYKDAIARVCAIAEPHYLVLLGGPDIVPHQQLENPAYLKHSANGDDDETFDSDLPYACDAPFATTIAPFITPRWVVGRLPDVPGRHGVDGEDAFLDVLETAIKASSRARAEYDSVFAITARVWERSTHATVTSLSSVPGVMKRSPDDKPPWDGDMENLLHLINCHGSRDGTSFTGEGAGEPPQYPPPAHTRANVRSHAPSGAVVISECCFGAQLFKPERDEQQPADRLQLGIVYEYLRRGAHCVFGSTCFSYGPDPKKQPERVNDYADVLCALFGRHVLAGRSTGEAALRARLDYVQWAREQHAARDAIDLKTVAQFILVGDPSAHPVQRTTRDAANGGVSANAWRARTGRRTKRRQRVAEESAALRGRLPRSVAEHNPPLDPVAQQDVSEIARAAGIDHPVARCSRLRVPDPNAAGGAREVTSYVVAPRRAADGARPAASVVTAVRVGDLLTNVRHAVAKSSSIER